MYPKHFADFSNNLNYSISKKTLKQENQVFPYALNILKDFLQTNNLIGYLDKIMCQPAHKCPADFM